jgi:hypothetical protein
MTRALDTDVAQAAAVDRVAAVAMVAALDADPARGIEVRAIDADVRFAVGIPLTPVQDAALAELAATAAAVLVGLAATLAAVSAVAGGTQIIETDLGGAAALVLATAAALGTGHRPLRPDQQRGTDRAEEGAEQAAAVEAMGQRDGEAVERAIVHRAPRRG